METGFTTNDLEIRYTTEDIEIRSDEGKPPKLIGYAIRFGELSNDLGGFKERVMPGAITNSLSKRSDIRALVNHDPEKLLGRTSNQTLQLVQDSKGLKVEIDPADTSYARDLMALVKRGDVKQMSFGFKLPDGGQRFTKENGIIVRELTNIDLREVSAVGTPAYEATSLTVRVDPSVVRYLTRENSRPNFARCRQLFRTTLVRG